MSLGNHGPLLLRSPEGLAHLQDGVATPELCPLKMKLTRLFPGLSFKAALYRILSGI